MRKSEENKSLVQVFEDQGMKTICMEYLYGTLVWNSCMEYLYGNYHKSLIV